MNDHIVFMVHYIPKRIKQCEFIITNLIPGKYVLLALPENDLYSPGYYKENDSTVFSWKEATIL